MTLPPHPSLVVARAQAVHACGVRELAHRKLDEILDMYEAGEPLWIVGDASWVSSSGIDDGLHMTISPRAY